MSPTSCIVKGGLAGHVLVLVGTVEAVTISHFALARIFRYINRAIN